MTLSKQLILLITFLFLLIFVGTLGISVHNTRSSLNQQLESSAQDTATSLGLSLTPAIAEKDNALVIAKVSAIFDRGYYEEITVERTAGKVLVTKKKIIRVFNVPDWFIKFIPLTPQAAGAEITSGWTRAATITVRSHPGYAYWQLWQNAEKTFWWLLVVAVSLLAFALIALKFLLKPLLAVRKQADAICNREFPIQEEIPWTIELRSVVLAMNRMSSKVKQMFERQTKIAEQMREEALTDSVTGIGNRRYFDVHLKQLLQQHESLPSSFLFVIELENFKEWNDTYGLAKGDELLKHVADVLRENFDHNREFFIARIAGADFGVIGLNILEPEAMKLIDKVINILKPEEGADELSCPIYAGVTKIELGESSNDLMAEADTALRAAQANAGSSWSMYDKQAKNVAKVRTATEWREFLTDVLAKKKIKLYEQKVYEIDSKTVMHREIFFRIPEEGGKLLNAGTVMPMIHYLGLSKELDKVVIESALKELASDTGDVHHAINLSMDSVRDKDFIVWLRRKLMQAGAVSQKIIFELSEYMVLNELDAVKNLLKTLKKVDSRCGIDHFGRGFSSFAYLHGLTFSYLKIDGSFIHNIDEQKDNQFFIQTIAGVAHNLDMKVIAESVETEKERKTLVKLEVDGLQGYLLSELEEL